MRVRAVLRELWHHRLRTGLAVVGVAVATAMLLDMLMLGGGLETSFARLLSNRGYGLRIAPAGTLPFDTEALIGSWSTLRDSLMDIPGVTAVAPLLAANVQVRGEGTAAPGGDGDPESARAFALGVDPAEQGVYRLLDGTPPDSTGLVVDATFASRRRIGAPVTLALVEALGVERRWVGRVTGVAEFLYAARHERLVALPLSELQRLSGREDAVSFAMLRTADAADPEVVRRAIEGGLPRVEAVTVAGLVDRARARLSYFRQLSLILGTVATAVTALLVGTIMAVSINDRYGTIAAMRAIGISRRTLVLSFAGEGLVLSAVGAALGIGLGVLTAGHLEGVLADLPGLPRAIRFFVLDAASVVRALAIVLAVGVVAGLAPAWRVTGLEIAATLHREEP